jgi:uncharacterized RDD family membrane protein YckC
MTDGPDPRPAFNPYAAPLYEPIQPPVRGASNAFLASRGARFVTRLVDNVLFGATLVPIAAAVFIEHASSVWLVTGVIPFLFTVYQCYLVATTGQSVAKKWFGLRVVRLDGSPVDFVSGVVLREWVVFGVGLVPGIGMLFRFADSVMIFGEERRCLHDQIAGTKVIPA